jgi:UDPglucose 6-dehydrogenase
VRDSPALGVAQILNGMGARVTVYDPPELNNAPACRSELSYADTPAGAAWGAQVVLLLTFWPECTALTVGSLEGIVARRNIDACNVLDPVPWVEAGNNARSGWPRKQYLPGGWTPPVGGRSAGSASAVPLVRDQLA